MSWRLQDYGGRVPQLAGRPYATEYNPHGASNQRSHHACADPAVLDKPGGWWAQLQAESVIARPTSAGSLQAAPPAGVMPSSPWQPAPGVLYDQISKPRGGHGCVANEMRYMPRTVWQ